MNKNDNIPDISADAPKKKFPWAAFNAIAIMSCFVGCCWFVSVLGLTFPLICIDILLSIILASFYHKWLKNGKFRKTVIALRISVIAIYVLAISLPFIAISSNLRYAKPIYQVKKLIYCYGVYYGGSMSKYLPEKLPKVCKDYKFVTQVSIPAQDYHPSAYLIFRTDTATMHELEEAYKQVDGAELLELECAPDIEEYKQEYGDDYIEYMPKCPNEIPAHVYARLNDNHIENFFDAVIYEVPSYYSKGCIFDYDSGLVVYWT